VGEGLTLADAARMMREAYEGQVLHPDADRPRGRPVHALRCVGRARRRTRFDTYEHVLSKLSLGFADYELERFTASDGTELLRGFLDAHWGDLSSATRRNRLSILKSFFDWAVGERHISFSPPAAIKGPRSHRPLRNAHDL